MRSYSNQKNSRLTSCVLRSSVFVFLFFGVFFTGRADAQLQPTHFRVGEKLTYTISFGTIEDSGYMELYVVSRGQLGGKDSVEIRSKFKTLGFVSATFAMIDETRTVFAAPDSGLPIFMRRTQSDGPLPVETVSNYLKNPTSNFDPVTLIYKVRQAAGSGSYTFYEGEQVYTATYVSGKAERLKTSAGEFDTTISTVQSEFLAVNGIKDLKINFTNDEDRVPVMFRFRTAKGECRITLVSSHMDETTPTVKPTPTATPTPVVVATPRPTATPAQYVENQPLLPELGFGLGETLSYNLSDGGKPVGVVTLEAKERKLFEKKDSLLLTATVTAIEPGNKTFALGDSIRAQVDPDTLAPKWFEGKFGGGLKALNQTVVFDPRTGNITFGGTAPIDGPVGTHSLLSLIYAMRSFNLQRSNVASNPVNDTRVAVFWETQPYVFTLRPDVPADLTIGGSKISAQLITINTGNPKLDALGIKVWLGTTSRVPVRISVGTFQADLIIPPKNIVQ
ncbi:MAG TPA: DUF3108 domain-containing protein [Pyrinomonadaceae bacterium]|nr:DUF3108 domain-containing protein [Pyrinomonadaceae bacterium]